MNLWVGTSGFAYKEWKGRFYPEDLSDKEMLAHYASRLPAVSQLVNDDAWEGLPSEVAYNASASFLAYVIQTYGAAPLKRIYGATSEAFERRFQEAYGRSLSQAEAEWKVFCGT